MAETAALTYPPSVADHTETDWLAVAQHITSLYEPPATGRPSEALTDVFRVHKLLTLCAEGNYAQTAILSAGFAKQTYYNWQQQAKAGNVAAIALLDAMEKAFSDAEAGDNRLIRKAAAAGPQFWAAAATRLERRHPDRWGKRQDDSTAPKVIVQLGASSGDVKVGVLVQAPASTPLPVVVSQGLPEVSAESLGKLSGSDNQRCVNQNQVGQDE